MSTGHHENGSDRQAEERLIALDLTAKQRSRFSQETGLACRALQASPVGYISMALAARSLRAGRPPVNIRAPFLLELTEAQQRRLQRDLGTSVSALLVDPDLPGLEFSESWSDNFPPFSLGRLCVAPHHTPEHPEGDVEVIRLVTEHCIKGVFGTGHHPTTVLAAQLLETWLEPRASVADIGTGSGILAIAAARLGAGEVLALDRDRGAADLAQQNIQLNQVTDRVVVRHRELEADGDGPFDLVIANLFPSILIQLAASFASIVRLGGTLIISGVVSKRIDEIAAVVESASFQTLEHVSDAGWAARALQRRTLCRYD